MRISDWSSDVCSSDLSVQATLKNPKHELLPGMFADVVIDTGAPQRYLTVPQTAIAFNPYGETVFVVTTADKFNADADAKAKAAGEKSPEDRKSGVEGKSLSVRVDSGGRRLIKKKKKNTTATRD